MQLIDISSSLYYNALQKGWRYMMTITLRLSDRDSELVRRYAQMHGLTVSDVMRNAILEKIEDELSSKVWEKAYAEYAQNPVTYSLEDIERELGLQ